jgi:hypothetical protein
VVSPSPSRQLPAIFLALTQALALAALEAADSALEERSGDPDR